MKKILTLLPAILIFTFATLMKTNAQWVQQSPLPTAANLNSTWFLTQTHGFAVGSNNLLLETTNGGTTWQTKTIGESSTDPFYNIAFADNDLTGFISGNSSTVSRDIYRTTNGGQSWTKMTSFPLGGSWNVIDFITPDKIFFGSNGACVYTADGGNTFVLKSGYPTCPIMYGMDFRDEQVGLAGGTQQNTQGIYKTTNGGTTWQKKFSTSANDVLWWTNTIALATVGTSIYRSSNEGETWTLYASGITTGLLKLERIDDVTLAGVSAKGDVWRSTNEGLTWVQVFDGPGDLPASWSLHFVDAQHGSLVGQSGFIYSSDDGGITWKQLNSGAGVQVTDLSFLNNNFGMGVGENGYLFRTTDGGNFWGMQKLEVTGQVFGHDESLHGISIVDSAFAAVAGPGGTVFSTNDGGLSWEPIAYPDLPGLFFIEDVEFVDHNEGWVVGSDLDLGHDKTVYHTTDGGNTWTLAMSNPAYMFAIDFVDTEHGWITTAGSAYLRTTNGGATWTQGNYPPYFTSPMASDIKFANQNVGWVVGWDGFVAKTTDGGVSWALQNIGTTSDHLFSVHVVSTTEVWAAGREANLPMDGVVYHTIDGGATWTREVSTPYPYWGYTITGSGGNVWIAGSGGHIYKKSSGCTSPVVSISASGPTSFCTGGNVVLNTTVTGTDITYQWKKNGLNISGATSNIYTASKAGSYTVVVSNSCGTATSNAITVTVNKNPAATISPAGTVNMCTGNQTVLTANTGSNLSYQWLKNTANIAGATSSTYSATKAGKYSVKITSAATGCSQISNVTTIKITCKTTLEVLTDDEVLIVYPNPAQHQFVVDLKVHDGQNGAADVQLINTLGQLIYATSAQMNNGEIHQAINPDATLAAGNYFIRVITADQVYTSNLQIQ
jgi:photosystem II stability/assembly factor-like uncharacterized protein